VISSPTTYTDVQQELIAEIHRTAIWSVVVTVDGKITIAGRSDFIDRVGSYIILTPDGNIKSLEAEINASALEGTKLTRLWKSEARFVVAGANEFKMSKQTDILDYLSKFGIYNCIIVSPEHYILEEVYSRQININDVDTGMKLGVYTWFPYQSSDRCTDVNDITLLDSWVISAQGHFTKNTDLFPRKITNSLNGCPMKAVVRNSDWIYTTYYDNDTNSNASVVTLVSGFETDLLMMVLKEMNMTFVHIPTPEGFEIEESLTDNLIRAMFAREAFIALGLLGTHILVNPFLDSTNSYYIISFRWYVPCSVKYPRWSSIFRILSVELWLVLIISIVNAGISITYVGRYSCTSEWQGYKTLTSSFTNVWAVILGVSVSTMPRTPSLRSLFLGWVCFSLAFSTVFQAFLTIFLIDSGYKTPIQNMDELFGSGIKLYYPPDFDFIFENGDDTEISIIQTNLANCPSYEVCLDWAMYHKNISILFADLDAEYYSADNLILGESSEPLLCRLEDGIVYNNFLRMVMLNGDPLLGRVSEIIDRLFEAGIYNFWISLDMHMIKFASRKIAIVNPLDEYYSFNLYHMQPAFYLLLKGWCLSSLCFLFEFLFKPIKQKEVKLIMGGTKLNFELHQYLHRTTLPTTRYRVHLPGSIE